jgi:hypothetical protein
MGVNNQLHVQADLHLNKELRLLIRYKAPSTPETDLMWFSCYKLNPVV